MFSSFFYFIFLLFLIICLFPVFLFTKEITSEESFNVTNNCWSNSNGQNEKWFKEGDIIDRGKYWYLCSNGKIIPSGCIDDKENRISLNKTFINGNFLVQCVRWFNLIKFKTVVGESWLDGKFWWECAWEGIYLKKRQIACFGYKNKYLLIGEQEINNLTIYECQKNEYGNLNFVAIECISNNGKRYKIGKQWTEGDFLFYCKKRIDNLNCEKTCIGCVYKDKNLFDGDRFQLNNTIFKCEIPSCLEDKIQLKYSSSKQLLLSNSSSLINNYRIQRQCILRAGRAILNNLGCVFEKDGIKRLILQPETYTIWIESIEKENNIINKIAIACIKTNNNDLVLHKFKIEEIEENVLLILLLTVVSFPR
ncbi:hypothetical protein Mgra_00005459 [Meloidogyne graminicola]|uniref:Abnormal cell migration protein 18-like fibronectin type I domain-containing protein n=1 Tax=Meloidogyne graminicola TaxID=189291 RepID=A0A8S9ZPM8_9BILA|nr:hypothetical protein Mgra_00005459 [Meloidogyne graminicola]